MHSTARTQLVQQLTWVSASGGFDKLPALVTWVSLVCEQCAQYVACAQLEPDWPADASLLSCSYDVASPRRIRLIFNQAEVGQVHINSGLETLIAPALLPRGGLNQQILLALKEVSPVV